MNAADRRRLTPLLGATAVVLLLSLLALRMEMARAPHWNSHATPPPLPAARKTMPAPKVLPLNGFSATWQQPLFNPDRKPAVIAQSATGLSNLQLTGIILLPNLKMAILHDKQTGKDYRVREGQSSPNEPVLLELHPHSAVVQVSGSRQELQLLATTSKPATNRPGDVHSLPAAATSSSPSNLAIRASPQPVTPTSAKDFNAMMKQAIEARRRKRQPAGGH